VTIPYILITIIVLAVVAVALFLRTKKKPKPISKLGAISLAFVVAGIVFGENRLLGYTLFGVGIALAIVDIFIKSKK